MNTPVTASLHPDELAELDRVCRQRRMDRDTAISDAIRWYIGFGGDFSAYEDVAEEPEV